LKLLNSEYQFILKLIEASDKTRESFQLQKKKGWVTVVDLEKAQNFSFIRKDKTIINAAQKFEKTSVYFIKFNEFSKENLTKSAFINYFKEWLMS